MSQIKAAQIKIPGGTLLGRTSPSAGAAEELTPEAVLGLLEIPEPIETFQIALSDMSTELTTGDGKAAWLVPYDCTILDAWIGLSAAQSSSGAVTIDARLAGGATIFTTPPSIDANEATSLTGTAVELDITSFTKGQIILFDIDAAGTGAKGLQVVMSVRHEELEESTVLNTLSGTFTLAENAAAEAVAGALTGVTAGSSLSLTNDAGGRVALSGNNVVRGATALDYESATSHSFTVRETNADGTNSPRDTNLSLTVTNVADAATLVDLELDDYTWTEGVPVTINILNAATGSTITVNSGEDPLPAGLTLNSGARTITGTPTTSGTGYFVLDETLADSPNSPFSTHIDYEITELEAPNVPVLSNLSEGWTTGDNPPNWQTSYDGIYYDPDDGTGDQLRARYRFDGGSWTTTDWVPWDIDAVVNGIAWPFLSDGSMDDGGDFEVQEEAGRDIDMPTEITSGWSTSWTDEVIALPSNVEIVNLGQANLPWGYGSGALSTSAIAHEAGDKVLISIFANYNTATDMTVTAVDGSAVPITLNLVYESSDKRFKQFYADRPSAGTITVTADPDNSTQYGSIIVDAVRLAEAGGPTATYYNTGTNSGQASHDVDGGVSLPTNGAVHVALQGNGTKTFTGAEKLGDLTSSPLFCSAVQDEAGDITIVGHPGGVTYTSFRYLVTSWSLA